MARDGGRVGGGKGRRLPPHVLNAYRLRNELAALIRHRRETGASLPAVAALAHVIARVLVVIGRDGVNFSSFNRLVRDLGIPRISETLAMAEIKRAGAEGEHLGRAWRLPAPALLGAALGVDEAERAALSLRLIGARDVTSVERRRHRDRERKMERRRAAGMEARMPKSQPWTLLGISRATYFRRKNKGLFPTDACDSGAVRTGSETRMSARHIYKNGNADIEVSPPPVKRTFEPASPAPPIRTGGIRDRALRGAVRPHERVQAIIRDYGPMPAHDLARLADVDTRHIRPVLAEIEAEDAQADRHQRPMPDPIAALAGRIVPFEEFEQAVLHTFPALSAIPTRAYVVPI